MKKTVLTLMFGILLGGVLFAQNNKAAASFKKTEHNFGTVKEDGKINCSFEFTNTGKAPLIINRVSASCGCTTPSYTKEPVLPGKSGKIDVAYNTVARPGSFSKSITVYTNAPDTVYQLHIKGSVTPKK